MKDNNSSELIEATGLQLIEIKTEVKPIMINDEGRKLYFCSFCDRKRFLLIPTTVGQMCYHCLKWEGHWSETMGWEVKLDKELKND